MGISSLIAALATDVGVGATTAGVIGSVGAGVLEGSALGALGGAITGGDPGLGALTGGLTGGLIPGAGAIGADLGISPIASEAIGGAAGGAIGSAITGGNPLTSTLEGAAAGGISGALGGGGQATSGGASVGSGGVTGGAGPSAAGTAAPASAPSLGGADVTVGIPGTPGVDSGTAGGSFGLPPGQTTPFLDSLAAGGGGASPVASAAAGGGAAGAGGGFGSSISKAFNDPTFSNITDALGKNASWLVPAAGLGFSALKGDQSPVGLDQLKATAGNLQSNATGLMSYLNSGTLPAGLQQSLTQAGDSAKAAIRSSYAARGLTGSSAEARDVANVDQTVAVKGADIAMNLLQTGVNESQVASSLYEQILRTSLEQDQQLSNAIGAFAGAAAGGGFSRPASTSPGG